MEPKFTTVKNGDLTLCIRCMAKVFQALIVDRMYLCDADAPMVTAITREKDGTLSGYMTQSGKLHKCKPDDVRMAAGVKFRFKLKRKAEGPTPEILSFSAADFGRYFDDITEALKVNCPKCSAKAGTQCVNMAYKEGNRPFNSKAHQTRGIISMKVRRGLIGRFDSRSYLWTFEAITKRGTGPSGYSYVDPRRDSRPRG